MNIMSLVAGATLGIFVLLQIQSSLLHCVITARHLQESNRLERALATIVRLMDNQENPPNLVAPEFIAWNSVNGLQALVYRPRTRDIAWVQLANNIKPCLIADRIDHFMCSQREGLVVLTIGCDNRRASCVICRQVS